MSATNSPSNLPLRRLFIANRGEIARRIALTARRLGIETVVLTDQAAPPGYLADSVSEFVQVPEESPALYLDAAKMLAYAQAAGCDSVHPGFGFLSENAGFAAAIEASGLVWVGPRSAAIEAMASKASARTYAERARVPCVRGLSGFPVPDSESGDFSVLESFAKTAHFPLLMKAAFGGGGKGMRLVQQMSELRPAALRAKSEAQNSFGNGSLICEEYLGAPRHVEVQILADKHGRVVAVGDRDCSLQRRHQKIIEEAPAIGLTPATRAQLHAAAVALAAAVGYDSTGTVEFLVDWNATARAGGEQKFFFLEMNTRLQVEHPVSEEVHGLDLVEWQLRVACGQALPESFTDLPPRGHSVEVRIYAEDVRQSFFPAPGPVAAFKPAVGPGLRWELGLDEVGEITGRFDPMIAKLIATGATRAEALARLGDGLARTVFAGPANNIDLLRELVTASRFRDEAVTTHFLGEALPDLLAGIDRRLATQAELGEHLLDLVVAGKLRAGEQVRGADPVSLTQAIFSAGGATQAAAAPAGAPGSAAAAGGWVVASSTDVVSGKWRVSRGDGQVRTADARAEPFWYAALVGSAERQSWVAIAGQVYTRRIMAETRRADAGGSARQNTDVVAPVPGKVIAVKVAAGTEIEVGTTLFVLESMKMEFEVKAARAGTLSAVKVSQNDQVNAGQQLASWTA